MSTHRPTVVLCSDLAGHGWGLEQLRRELARRTPQLEIAVVEGLCARPQVAADVLDGRGAARGLVVLCARRAAGGELQAQARRRGFGPYDVAVVAPPLTRGAEVAAAAIAGAAARVAALAPGQPTRKTMRAGGLSRGALLRLAPAFDLRPVAVVDPDRCAGIRKCGLCAPACPSAAISAAGGLAAVHTPGCDACGMCLAACPTGAISIAGCSTAQVQAQLAGLLDGAHPAVLFACERALAGLADDSTLDGWSVVELPGLAMLTSGWVAQTVLAGAAEVEILPCDGACCAAWRDPGRRELARRLVDSRSSRQDTPLVLEEPAATVAALALRSTPLELRHPSSALGLIELDDGCTTCGACATACPTGALVLDDAGDRASLIHDPSRCTACGLCSRACPEQVIRHTRGFDSARLAAGPVEIAWSARMRCRSCGVQLPPAAVMARTRAALADRWPAMVAADPGLCPACALRG